MVGTGDTVAPITEVLGHSGARNGGTREIVVPDMVGTGDMVPRGVHDGVTSTYAF